MKNQTHLLSVSLSSELVISYAEMKRFLRLNSDTDQSDVELFIRSATVYVETICGQLFIPRSVVLQSNNLNFPLIAYGDGCTDLSISYINSDNETVSISTENLIFDLSQKPNVIVAKDTFSVTDISSYINRPFTISFTSGISCPSAVKHAIKLIASSLYDERSLDSPINNPLMDTANKLLAQYKLYYPYILEE